MLIYWTVTQLLLLLSGFELATRELGDPQKIKRVITYLFLLGSAGLIMFAGFRGPGSGIDDWQYLAFFADFSRETSLSGYHAVASVYRYENLFMLLAWLLSWFTHESYYFTLFISLIAVSTNAWIYKKYSPLMLCSLCLYSAHLFINKDMNQIRFGLCSAFTVGCLCAAANRRYVLAAIFLLLGIQSHSTGYAALLVMPFLLLRPRRYYALGMVLGAIPLGLIGGKRLFLDSLGIVPVIGDRAMGYSGTLFDTALPVISLANLKNIVFITFFTFYLLRHSNVLRDRTTYLLFMAYAVGAAVRIIFSDFSIIGGRVGNLFLHCEPLLLAFLMMRLRHPLLNGALLWAVTSYYLAYNTLLSVQSIAGYSIAPSFALF